jgi:hypothetical protein
MKAPTRTTASLSLSLILSVGMVSSCVQEEAQNVQGEAQGLIQETAQENVTPSEDVTATEVVSTEVEVASEAASGDSDIAQVEEVVVDSAAARRAKFQADMKAKMAARIQEQASAKLAASRVETSGLSFCAEGHLIDEFGNHIHEADDHVEVEVKVKKAELEPKAKEVQKGCQCPVCLEKAARG